MKLQPLFDFEDGFLTPRSARNQDGTIRRPDGREFYDLDAAARLVDLHPTTLAKEWFLAWDPYLSARDRAALKRAAAKYLN